MKEPNRVIRSLDPGDRLSWEEVEEVAQKHIDQMGQEDKDHALRCLWRRMYFDFDNAETRPYVFDPEVDLSAQDVYSFMAQFLPEFDNDVLQDQPDEPLPVEKVDSLLRNLAICECHFNALEDQYILVDNEEEKQKISLVMDDLLNTMDSTRDRIVQLVPRPV